jgi:hypothetical protein
VRVSTYIDVLDERRRVKQIVDDVTRGLRPYFKARAFGLEGLAMYVGCRAMVACLNGEPYLPLEWQAQALQAEAEDWRKLASYGMS